MRSTRGSDPLDLPSRSIDYAWAAASGVLLALSFPKYGHPAFGWIALTPLLVALAGESRITSPKPVPFGRAFLLGLVTGVVYFTGTLYWITRVMAVYGGLQQWVAVLVNAALIAYLALFPAVFAAITRRIVIAHGRPALMAAPLVWVATELGRTHVLTGFPWVLLGYSQITVLPIAQFASIFGVYGVSMLVASVSAGLALVATNASGPAKAGHYLQTRSRFTPAVVVFAIVIGVAIWGSRRAAGAEWTRAGEAIRVGLIQGNVQQGQKWDPNLASRIFTDYLAKSRQAIREGAELVLWPESAAPFMFDEDAASADRVRALAREARVPILVGSDEVEWRPADRGRVPDKFFNSAFLVRADGSTAGVYRKMHLVPFGEYVPLQKLLFFAAPLTEQVGTFAPGLDPALLPVNGHPISVAICYEVVYPSLVRRFVAGGSEMLTTITNDAWFGPTSAPYQHFEQASMRAIEEGRYMVRAANTGISGIVDPYGRVLERTDIFQAAVLVGEARFLRTSTFYARHGDILAYASVVMTAALLVSARRRTRPAVSARRVE
jgi:apolipoprotein N-acyltransferase